MIFSKHKGFEHQVSLVSASGVGPQLSSSGAGAVGGRGKKRRGVSHSTILISGKKGFPLDNLCPIFQS